MKLADNDVSTVINGLRVAASGYRDNAKICREAVKSESPQDPCRRVAAQFETQASDSERIANELELGAEG